MRLVATADLHYNHPRSRRLADELIDQINALEADAILLIGDTAVADGDSLDRCLGRFRFTGPRLFVPGNHELWTSRDDSYRLFREELPRRIREAGWRWLQDDPFVAPLKPGGAHIAVVGSIGWYDYSFAHQDLKIPRRFYEHKVSPGAAMQLGGYGHLVSRSDDIPPHAANVMARWNDGAFVKLHRNDEAFLDELLHQLEAQLTQLASAAHIVAAVHHVPLAALMPEHSHVRAEHLPFGRAMANPGFLFARAFLGSPRIGRVLLHHPNVRTILCGHSHLPVEADLNGVRAINIGSGYRAKRHCVIELS